jgi:hypothetical protein
VNEGISAVDPCHEELVLHEVFLDVQFEENVEFLLECDYLQSVLFGRDDCAFDNENGACSPAELVDLRTSN